MWKVLDASGFDSLYLEIISDLMWPESDFLYCILLTPVYQILVCLRSDVSEARLFPLLSQ